MEPPALSSGVNRCAPDGQGGEDRDFVQSLARGLQVLTAFDADHAELTMADVAKRTGLSRATARRLLHTFESLGLMSFDGKHFGLTPRVLDLGYAFVSSLQLPQIAQPTMEKLSETVNESVSMAVLDGCDIVYVARVPTRHVMSISLGLGSRLPAALSSMGRVLLASLPDDEFERVATGSSWEPRTELSIRRPDELREAVAACRRDGFAVVDGELEDNVRSIAAPLTDRRGRTIAALNVGTSAARVSLADLHDRVLPELLDAAQQISTSFAKR